MAGRTQAETKIARRNINNLRYADDTTLMAEREEELKSVLMKVKEESEKVGLKAQHSENKDDKPRQCIKKQRHYFTDKDLSSQSYGVSSNHVQM